MMKECDRKNFSVWMCAFVAAFVVHDHVWSMTLPDAREFGIKEKVESSDYVLLGRIEKVEYANEVLDTRLHRFTLKIVNVGEAWSTQLLTVRVEESIVTPNALAPKMVKIIPRSINRTKEKYSIGDRLVFFLTPVPLDSGELLFQPNGVDLVAFFAQARATASPESAARIEEIRALVKKDKRNN